MQGHIGMLVGRPSKQPSKQQQHNKTEKREVKEDLHGGAKCCQKKEHSSDFKVMIALHAYPSLSRISNVFLICLTGLLHLVCLGDIFFFFN